MAIILVATLISLLLFVTAVLSRFATGVVEGARHMEARLTVADIQARLAAEPARTYVPIARRW